MDPSINWPALRALRKSLLDEDLPEGGYWKTPSALADYDQTLAVRTGWQWDAVFRELKRRGWQPPGGRIMDWGCGTGIAARKYLEHWGTEAVETLSLWDAAGSAIQFASRQVTDAFPEVQLRPVRQPPYRDPGVLLISHVIPELDEAALDQLVELAAHAEAVIWLESGRRIESRKLSAVRDRLVDRLQVFAPCTHQGSCPMLAEANEPHACQHLTRPPASVHQSPTWSAFARELNMDLGSVSYAFLCLNAEPQPMPEGFTRVVGHPQPAKGFLRLLCCQEASLDEWSLTPRADKAIYKEAKKEKLFPLIRCEVKNQRIRSVERWQDPCEA